MKVIIGNIPYQDSWKVSRIIRTSGTDMRLVLGVFLPLSIEFNLKQMIEEGKPE